MPDIFINTDRPVDRSIVAGINQPQREAPIGTFVAGSSYDVNLYFVKNDGSYDALSGVGGTDIHVAISTISRPESGTFTLTDGTDTTAALTYGASAQVVEDALNALNSDTGLNLGTVSLVDVVKVNDTQYTITFRTFGAMTALSGSTVSLFPESTPTGSIAVTGSATVYAQQTIELTRQPAIFQETWSTITNGFSGTIALNTTRLLQSLALEPGQPFYLEVKLDAETVAREIVGVEHSTMPASAFSGAAIALKSTEGVDILSTGETGGTKYLREDGDGTSSWQTVAGAAGDMEASTYDPTTVAGDAFAMNNMAEGTTTKILTAAERTTIGTVAPHIADTVNPHSVTKSQVGLGNVDNTADADKPVSTAQQTALDLKADDSDLTAHTGNTSNPHAVSKAQVGLTSADDTSDTDKPVSTAQQTALDLKQDILAEGAFVDGDKAKLDLIPQKLAGSAVMTSLETGTVSITLKSTTGYMAVIWGNGVGEVKGAGVAGTAQAFSSTTGAGEIHCFSCDSGGNPSGDLTYLYCHNNNLTSLDVSGLTALTDLACYNNNLTSLDISGFTALTELNCFSNNLTSLDASGLTALTTLNCGTNNNLTSLDVSGLTALTSLSCYSNNNLTSLDISGLTALTYLYCYGNNLTSILATGVDLSFEYYGYGSTIRINSLSEAALIAFVDSLATTTTGVISYGSNTGSAAFETWLTNNPTLDKGYIWLNS